MNKDRELTKENTLARIEGFKEQHVHLTTKLVEDYSFLVPQLSVLNYDTIGKDYGVINYDIPGELMESDAGKNIFAQLIPEVLDNISKEGKLPLCVGWSTEAWMRVSAVGATELPKNWKDLPKTEGLINYFESEYSSDLIAYDLVREGSRINESGDIIDNVVLTLNTAYGSVGGKSLEGRFCNLFTKYKETHKNANI